MTVSSTGAPPSRRRYHHVLRKAAGSSELGSEGSTASRSPLHVAAMSNPNPAVIETLVRAGAKVQAASVATGRPGALTGPPLRLAAARNGPAVIEALIAAGADPEARDDEGGTLLHTAATENDDPTVVEALLSLGIGLEARDAQRLCIARPDDPGQR